MYMQTVGLLFNPLVTTSKPLAEEIATWLEMRGIGTWVSATSNAHTHQTISETDLVITLGGDGTILRAIPVVASLEIPLIGINLGRVGFLTECMPDQWPEMLTAILNGGGEIEERMMLQVSLLRAGQEIYQDSGLNDAVVSRGALARTVRLSAHIDGAFLTRYVADGLIISTATGSTAYSYAVGGPILPPWIDNLLLVPISPHLSMERPLVLDASSIVKIVVHTETPGMLTVDGHLVSELLDGDCVQITRSPQVARFLRLRSKNGFFESLVDRLTPHNGDLR
ncbi:MAG: NAD(+)/NADH kinase [Anaerolineae bacterium]|nr:NAD(+)/NADH kinase [Anaerolineae bacterium]